MTLTIKDCAATLSGVTVYEAKYRHSGGGLGRDAETRFGIEENNRPGADHEASNTEMKASIDTACFVTMLTKNPSINYQPSRPRESAVRTLTENFASPVLGEINRHNLYYTLKMGKTTNANGHAMSLSLDNDRLAICVNGTPYCAWSVDILNQSIEGKIGRLMLAKGSSNPIPKNDPRWQQVSNGVELREGRYTSVSLFQDFSIAKFWEAFQCGKVVIDLRAYRTDGHKRPKIRDHGTAFRIAPNNLECLYLRPPQTELI